MRLLENQSALTVAPSGRPALRAEPFSAANLRDWWSKNPDTGGRLALREKVWREVQSPDGAGTVLEEGAGSLAVRTSARPNSRSLTICVALYSRRHGKTVQQALRRFRSPVEISNAALEEVRAAAAEFAADCDNTGGVDRSAALRLKAHESHTLATLAEIYYAGPHFLGLKNDRARNLRRYYIDSFLAYAPNVKGRARHKFGARKLAVQAIDGSELEQYHSETVERYGNPYSYNRARSYVLKMLRWLAVKNYLPATSVFRMEKEKEDPAELARNVTLDNAMLKAFWQATEDLPAYQRGFVRLLALTGQRREIISDLRYDEIFFNHDTPQIRISALRAKNKRAYMFPITPQITELINSVPRIVGNPYVFAVSEKTPISGFNTLKKKIDDKMKVLIGDQFYPWRFHDFRRLFTEKCNAAHVEPRARELLLAHTPKWVSSSEIHYNVTEYIPEKVAAMHAVDEQIMRVVFPERFVKAEDEKAALLKAISALPLAKLQNIKALIAQ